LAIAPPLPPLAAHGLPRAQHQAGDVDVEHAPYRGGVVRVDPPGLAGDAGIVDERVDPPELAVDRLEHGNDRGLVGGVGLEEHRPAAAGLDLVHDGAGARLAAHIIDADRIAALGRGERRRGADAAAGAGDEGDLGHGISEGRGGAAATCSKFLKTQVQVDDPALLPQIPAS
jgi:hypothetical protein